MQRYFAFLAIVFPGALWSQSGKDNFVAEHASLNLDYGRSYARFATPFQDYFKSQLGAPFAGEMQVYSLSLNGPLSIGNGISADQVYDANIGLNYRTTPDLQSGDTATYRMTVFDLNYATGYDLLYFWDNIDLPLRIGWDWGMSRLHRNGEKSRNPFFSLIVQVQPRIILWKFALSAKAEIGYDITSKKWRPKDSWINNEMPFKNNYGQLSFSIGYVFE